MIDRFKEVLGERGVLVNEPMSKHTTFRIGGCADVFLMPENEDQLSKVCKIADDNNLPVFVLGNGSNILVGDKGIRGVVISTYKKLNSIEITGEEVYVGAGALLSTAATAVAKASLEGMEFASGIPGTIGGAVYMNAGAYGSEMKDIIKLVRFMDKDGNIYEKSGEACGFGYRKSCFTNTDLIILGCTLSLKKGNIKEICNKISDLTNRRVTKQPVDKASAGSTFKRPEGNFAGTLIEQAGLKGKRIGGAEVSTKHAGFIINADSATAKDVIDLIDFVKNTVYEKSGIMLEPEVKMVGEF